jgi:hypothetical protein
MYALAQSLGNVSDRLLGIFVPKIEAGACVAEHGKQCRCIRACTQRCPDHGERYLYDCYGSCVFVSCGCS